jgi:hypothetical protein
MRPAYSGGAQRQAAAEAEFAVGGGTADGSLAAEQSMRILFTPDRLALRTTMHSTRGSIFK